MNEIIAPNIKAIMAKRGLKQYEVAKKLGYTKYQFNLMLNGKKLIRDVDILNIAKCLEVDVNILFGKEGG